MRKKFTKIALIITTFVGSLTLASSNAYALDPRVQEYLYTIQLNLALAGSNKIAMCDLLPSFEKLDNEISCNGAKSNACTTATVYFAALQDLINQGSLSPQDSEYIKIRDKIMQMRSDAGCTG
ncbi:hypothetical protein [Nostoc sp. MG11]|uniref:hypothetical protein n=1 Tax=Nostoc sp. MG11 TaxID=2721166 RepID=UPI001865B0D4|nr:hypothetical protein [Nostoc sp. MG11]